MAVIAETVASAAPSTLEVARPKHQATPIDALRGIAAATGRTPGAVVREFIRASMGPGKLSFEEYVALGLYDTARFAGADLRSFVGRRTMGTIWDTANFRLELYGLITNKIAMGALLAAHGLPTILIKAVYSEAGGRIHPRALHDKTSLLAFLRDPANYPIFGKPTDGYQSLGAASFDRYDTAADMLVTSNGDRQPAAAFAEDVTLHYRKGYLFQPRISPHGATAALCGERLSTVRVLTVCVDGEPKVLRACEKIPGGSNIADNYWRAGNLLVHLDPQTGLRGRAISGKGLDLAEHQTHPDSGGAIAGTHVPNWSAVCAVALEGARLMSETPLIGWDVAPVADGAVIVEVNCTPDLTLPQLADRRGILDAEFEAFLAKCRVERKAWKRHVKAFNRA